MHDDEGTTMRETLHSELASADPAACIDDATRDDLVRRLSADVRREALAAPATVMPWWKRRRAIIPLGIAGVAALTGAAVLVPLGLAINGTEVDLDAEIPINYTTDTGVAVSCRYGIYFGNPATRGPADEQLAAFVEDHDWTGIGQRVYDDAMANPFVPGPNDDWEVDTQEIRDDFSFFTALNRVIWDEIPVALREHDGQEAGAASDCTGTLR